MKKTVMVCIVVLLGTFHLRAQESTKDSLDNNIKYSFLWGLFKSENYSKDKTPVFKFENSFSSPTILPVDTSKYEERNLLWGAIKWTEKKEKKEKMDQKSGAND